MLPVTSLFAGLFALYFVRLAIAVIRLRRNHRVALGTGGVAPLEAAVRVHGNFAEYVPLGLVLMGLNEYNGTPAWLVALLGCTLGAGRVFHGQGLTLPNLGRRVKGMQFTFGTLVVLAVINIGHAVRSWVL